MIWLTLYAVNLHSFISFYGTSSEYVLCIRYLHSNSHLFSQLKKSRHVYLWVVETNPNQLLWSWVVICHSYYGIWTTLLPSASARSIHSFIDSLSLIVIIFGDLMRFQYFRKWRSSWWCLCTENKERKGLTRKWPSLNLEEVPQRKSICFPLHCGFMRSMKNKYLWIKHAWFFVTTVWPCFLFLPFRKVSSSLPYPPHSSWRCF